MKRITHLCALFLLLFTLSLGAAGFSQTNPAASGQQKTAPITKEELIAMIKKAGPRQLSQGDIALQVDKRGLAFKLDDQAIAELKAAGAQSLLIDSIKHSTEDAAAPKEAPHPKLEVPGSDDAVG
ncbi:MAG TPA: hypothetical protein VI756_23720, partial [Blastocatellia bacterium]